MKFEAEVSVRLPCYSPCLPFPFQRTPEMHSISVQALRLDRQDVLLVTRCFTAAGASVTQIDIRGKLSFRFSALMPMCARHAMCKRAQAVTRGQGVLSVQAKLGPCSGICRHKDGPQDSAVTFTTAHEWPVLACHVRRPCQRQRAQGTRSPAVAGRAPARKTGPSARTECGSRSMAPKKAKAKAQPADGSGVLAGQQTLCRQGVALLEGATEKLRNMGQWPQVTDAADAYGLSKMPQKWKGANFVKKGQKKEMMIGALADLDLSTSHSWCAEHELETAVDYWYGGGRPVELPVVTALVTEDSSRGSLTLGDSWIRVAAFVIAWARASPERRALFHAEACRVRLQCLGRNSTTSAQ